MATASAGNPDARVMVLRTVDRAAGTLAFYTDVRAAKVARLAANPRVAVTGYDHATRLQLRLHGDASVATDGDAVDDAWAALSDRGRTAYQSVDPPGTPVARPPAASRAPADGGRAQFAVVTVILDQFEWLDLAVAGHRRAQYVRNGTLWTGQWLVP